MIWIADAWDKLAFPSSKQQGPATGGGAPAGGSGDQQNKVYQVGSGPAVNMGVGAADTHLVGHQQTGTTVFHSVATAATSAIIHVGVETPGGGSSVSAQGAAPGAGAGFAAVAGSIDSGVGVAVAADAGADAQVQPAGAAAGDVPIVTDL